MRCSLPIVLVSSLFACGGDDGADPTTNGPTTSSATTSAGTSSSDTSSASTSAADTTTETTAPADSSTSDATTTGETTGGASDPNYPPTEGGTCPGDFAPIELPGGNVCAPFCEGDGAVCPDPASGDALPVCTPFETKGGSGDPCEMHEECPDGEACGAQSTCVAVAFWGCRLECADGQVCSDGMTCSDGACAYP